MNIFILYVNNSKIINLILLLFIILVGLKIYYESDVFNLRCIVSGVDGKKYCVRERRNIVKASNLLATTTDKMQQLVFFISIDKY